MLVPNVPFGLVKLLNDNGVLVKIIKSNQAGHSSSDSLTNNLIFHYTKASFIKRFISLSLGLYICDLWLDNSRDGLTFLPKSFNTACNLNITDLVLIIFNALLDSLR